MVGLATGEIPRYQCRANHHFSRRIIRIYGATRQAKDRGQREISFKGCTSLQSIRAIYTSLLTIKAIFTALFPYDKIP
jgi:hypothetical protein